MSLPPGTRLGPYEIASALGAGGMGEVYRARDTRLERTVAIKILPESLSSDRERLERFQEEARILSTLNHPNLMAIYDVGSQDGLHFLVSEFFEGHTLRERLAAGPLSQRRAIEYGLQIAKGLAAAHEKGIVHRDLKPENIFVLRDERVKILDFGLAKQTAMAAADGTMTSADRTLPGTVLGTAGYMSPEQVRGEAADYRSDIFSFGTILYEMLAGQRAFGGDSSVEVMNSILKQEPPELAESGLNLSLGVQRIVQRCLEKRPDARFQSASDLAFALDSLSSTGTSSAGLRALKDTKQTRSRILLAASLMAALAIGVIATWLLRPVASHPAFTQITFRSTFLRHARFAPDGRTVVYDSTTDGKPTELFSTRTDTAEAQSLNLPASILSVSSTGELAVSLDTVFDPPFTPTGRLARVPGVGGQRHPDRHHHAPQRAADRIQRSGTTGHHGRPRLGRRQLLRQATAGARARRGAHGGPHHLHERRFDAREVRPPPPRQGELQFRLRCGFRGGELPALPRQPVRLPLRRQLVPLHDQGDGLLRPDQRPRNPGGRLGKDAGPLPGHQLQLGLAVPQLSIPGVSARPALAQSRRGLRGAGIQLRTRFFPGGRGGADRPGARLSGQYVREGAMKAGFVRELLGRSDYAIIGDIVEPNTKVLDLGCGEGELLEWLAANKGVDARGVEISGVKVQKAIARGVSVFQCDIDEGLADYPDQAFDYVILSQTLQETRHPRTVLREMLRVGRRVIVAFPNFGHWRVRLSMLFSGRAPRTKLFPYEWYESPNIHFLTGHHFEALGDREST